jgi:hypothetical protein
MAQQYPQRHRSHVLADESERFFTERLPQGWVVNKPQHDYGQDLRIELAEDGQLRGCELVVQVKASETPSGSADFETIEDLKTSTYNYLKRLLPVVMFVKYVRSEREAYWILLRDVAAPTDASQVTMTVRVPRANRLSELAWDWVAATVRKVTDRKLKKAEGLTVFLGRV